MEPSNISNSISLPVTTVQPSVGEVLQEVEDGVIPSDSFWVSCYKTSEPSIHTKVNAELDEVDRNLVNLTSGNESVAISVKNSHEFSVVCGSFGSTKILTPVQEYLDADHSNPRRPRRITAFDVSPDSSRFATGFLDGSVFLYPSVPVPAQSASFIPQQNGASSFKVQSKPHLSSVTTLKFFPSSRVLLSSGLDFSLTILPADLPNDTTPTPVRASPVRTLRAHTRSITSTAIIALGRNVVSASLDSTVKLWDVPSGSVIASISSSSPILSMSLGGRLPTPPDGEDTISSVNDERQVPEARTKTALCGLENGSFNIIDLGSRTMVHRSPSSSSNSPLSSITYCESHHLLATGSSSGLVTLYDIRSLGTPVTSFSRKEGSIEDLAFTTTPSRVQIGLAVATSDGLPFVATIVPEGPAVGAELIGVDCDPVRQIRVRSGAQAQEIWTASDDGIVRRYKY